MHLIVVIWLIVPDPRKGIFSATKTLAILIFMFYAEILENSYCFIYFKCLVVFAISIVSSTLNVLPCHDEIRWDKYHKWKKTFVMNLTFMKLDLALKIDPREKPIDDNSDTLKKLYED